MIKSIYLLYVNRKKWDRLDRIKY